MTSAPNLTQATLPAGPVRTRAWIFLLMALPLVAACSQESGAEVKRQSLAMPTLYDVLPSNTHDRSCQCLLHGQCANVADALPGHFEGRNLQCRVENEAARLVRCRVESRFVNEWQEARPIPGAWAWEEGVFYSNAPGAWCRGTGA